MTHGFRTDLGRSGYWIMSLAELRGTRNRASEAAAILLVDNTYGIFSAMNRIAYLLEIFEIMRFSDLNVNNLWCWTSAIHRLKECLFFLLKNTSFGPWNLGLDPQKFNFQGAEISKLPGLILMEQTCKFPVVQTCKPKKHIWFIWWFADLPDFFFGCVFAFWVWWDIIIPTDSGRNVDPHPV